MIPQIKELNFPTYATLSSATVNLSDMGDNTITADVKIDGNIAPDFSYDWEVEFRGDIYVHPLRKPQASKDNTSLASVSSLTFKQKAAVELQRYYFFTYAATNSGTAVADQYIAPLSLNLKNFCIAFNDVLEYYFHGSITVDLNPDWVYDLEPQTINISYSYLWDVLIKLYELYSVRWRIVRSGTGYVIKVGYATAELDHIFQYGFEGGLLKIERQVQDDNIRNILLGRGGEKNLPAYYFKQNTTGTTFPSDPDWIPELANIYFGNLRDINFRDYVKGWKTNPHRDLQGGTLSLEAYDAAYAADHFAYELGATDEFFRPVEYVKDDESIAQYGELWGALDNNEEIYPSIQGVTVDPIGRVDEVIAVQPITSDDIEAATESEAQLSNVAAARVSVSVQASKRAQFKIQGGEFTVSAGLHGALEVTPQVKRIYNQSTGRAFSGDDIAGFAMVENYTVKTFRKGDNTEVSPANIPEGTYYYTVEGTVVNNDTATLNVTIGVSNGKVVSSDQGQTWGNTFDIWIKNIWQSEKLSGESDTQYVNRVWTPILGGRDGEEAKVVFSTGWLSTSEDYEFTIVKGGVHFEQKECAWTDSEGVVHTYTSEWRLTLAKSDAEYEVTGLYLPNTRINAAAGDYFFFIGIELPHQYILWAEKRLNAYKRDELASVSDINPTWAVELDKIRIDREKVDSGEVTRLIEQIVPGASFKLADSRFITDEAYKTVYVQSMTLDFKEPTDTDPALIPDVSVVLSNEWSTTASVVDTLQGDIDALAKQVGSLSNIEQIVRVVGDKLYLRKDGIGDLSLSPTQFASLVTSLNFRQGLLGGQGWGFFKDEQGNWSMEVDRLNVRQQMAVNELVVNQISARGGMYVESAANMEITNVVNTTDGYVCYFDQKSGSVGNLFKVGDVALCHRYTAENGDLKFYKRRVMAVGVDHVVLSETEVNGTGIPAEGDVIVQYGSYTDPSRRYVKVRDVIGGGYERYIEGLDSVNATGTEYYFAGRQSGSYGNNPRFFIGNTQNFVEFLNGELNIKGKINTLSTYDGKTLSDYINDAAQSAADAAKAELQAQIDGVIEAFNGFGAPTLNNYPANEWTTDEERKRHDRDIYTDITPYVDNATTPTSGQSWKWYYNSPTDYGWTKIADSEAVKALQLAQLSVTGVDVLYQQTNSAVTPPVLPIVSPTTGQITNLNGWSTQAPPWADGMYMWQCTYTRHGDGQAVFTGPTCISGATGQQGQQGIQGPAGDDGKTSYFHIKYSAVANPTTASQMTETPSTYIGTYVDYTAADSNDPTKYTWSRFQGLQGDDGAQGIPGTNGIDGKTSYLHIKYSNDGGATFTPASGGLAIGETPGDYIGQYADLTQADSTNPADYTWAKIKGDTGPQGVPGAPGIDGKTYYTWIRYADNAQGGGISNNPTGKAYIGFAYNKTTATESNNPSDYAWSEIKGEQGVPGAPGADGIQYYTWIKYADNANGTGMYDAPTANTKYIGIAVNKTTATEGTNPADYTWSLFKGADGTSVTISSQSVKYSTDHGATQPADSTFTLPSVPTLTAGQYLWSLTTVTYSNSQSTKSYAVSRIGTNGTSVTISSTSVTYAKTTGSTQPADTAFTYASIAAANPAVGEYLWTKTVVNYSDGNSTKSYSVGRLGADGDDGLPGAPGADGKTTYVHYAYANSANGATGFSTTYFAGALYVGICTDYNQADPTDYTKYEWARLKGEDGANAKVVIVNADATAFTYEDDFATLVGTQRITLSATLQGTTGYQWSYRLEGQTAWTNWPDANGTSANVVLVHNGIFGTTARSITIRCTSGGVYDEVTIVKVSSGTNGTNGTNGTSFKTLTSPASNAAYYPYSATLALWKEYTTRVSAGWMCGNHADVNVGDTVCVNGIISDLNNTPCQFIGVVSAKATTVTSVSIGAGAQLIYGQQGQDAYTVLLSNESHIFEGDTEKAVAASTTSEVIAYKGATRVAATIGTITGAPTGMTVDVANNGTTSAKFTVSVTTALTTKQGTLTVPVTVDGKTFTQVFSWSLSLRGEDGKDFPENLILKSETPISTSSYKMADYYTSEDIEIGVEYTCTIWGELGSGKSYFGLFINGGNNNLVPNLVKVADGVYRGHGKALATVQEAFKRIVSLYHIPSTVTAYSRIDRIKLERGVNDDTTWAPALSEMGGPTLTEEYCLSTSYTTNTGGSWSPDKPTWTAGTYIWTRTKIETPTGKTYYTDPVCVTGMPGADAFVLDLTNEVAGVACNASGTPVGALPSTTIAVYKGASVDTGWTFQKTDSGCTSSLSGSTLTITALTADSAKVTIQANKSGAPTLTATMNVYKVKPGASYAPNLLSGTKTLPVSWLSDYPATNSRIVAINADGFAEYTQTRTATGALNSYAYLQTMLSDAPYKVFQPGKTYTLSFEYKSNVGVTVSLSIRVGSISNIVYVAPNASFPASTDWTRVHITCVMPANTYQQNICLLVANLRSDISNSIGDTASFRKFCIVEGESDVWTPAASEMLGQDGENAVVYSLELSANNISRNALGQLSTSAVTVQKYKTTGASARELTTEKTVRYQRIGYDSAWQTLAAAASSYSIPVPSSSALTAIMVELLDGAAVLDRERIPVITDASDIVPAGPNLVLNSTFAQGKYKWGNLRLGTGGIDPSMTLNGYTSVKIESQGASDYTWFGLAQSGLSVNPLLDAPEVGAYYVASIYVYYDSSIPITNSAERPYVELSRYKADGSRSQIAVTSIDLSKANQWQRIHCIGQCPADAVRLQFQAGILKNGKVWLACPQLTKGNQLSDFAASPMDTNYLNSAMRESGSIEGGLVLASLVRLGYTVENGEYKVTSGINGIATPSDAPAVWVGGEMIDRANSSAANAALTMLRHNGTAYFAGNTVRMRENVMQVGENIQLDDKGFSLNIGDNTALHIGNVAVSDASVASSQSIPLAGKNLGMSTVEAYFDLEGNLSPIGSTTLVLNTTAFPAGSVLSGVGAISMPRPSFMTQTDTGFIDIHLEILINDTVFQAFGYHLELSDDDQYVAAINIGTIRLFQAAKVKLRMSFPYVKQDIWEDKGAITGPNLAFTSGALSYDTGNQTTIGNNGILAVWGQSTFLCTNNMVMMRFGQNILRLDANGIRKSTNGGSSYSNL